MTYLFINQKLSKTYLTDVCEVKGNKKLILWEAVRNGANAQFEGFYAYRESSETSYSLKHNKFSGGEGGIRTPGGVAPTTIFETAAFNRSATSP